jgi:Cdc6-like AAA superfamily ATPase
MNRGTSEWLLIAGYSGIGKTALVQEIYKLIIEKRGYFVTGKFDQLQRSFDACRICCRLEVLTSLFYGTKPHLTRTGSDQL